VGVDRERGKGVDFVVGERSRETGRGLYERLRRYEVEQFYTDFWEAYQAILLPCLHKALKAKTHGMERGYSLMRHDLARFCRRRRRFSRSVEMMAYPLQLLFFLKVNGSL
jgi:Transposase and inactivated derivatives, IS1 family